MRALAEATLALVLFSDASRIDLGKLRREISLPVRLLGIGLPLTIAFGALAAAVIFDQLTFWEAAILGVILAPTDAALGQAVVTQPRVPGRIRQGLNVESGLNDGICVPLLFAAIAAADVQSHIAEGRTGMTLLVEEVGYGVVGRVRRRHPDRRNHPVRRAQGSDRRRLAPGDPGCRGGPRLRDRERARRLGFHRGLRRRDGLPGGDQARPRGDEPAHEEVGSVLNGLTFVIFGAILLGPALGELTWELALYAVLSLTSCASCRSRSRCSARRSHSHPRLSRLVRPTRPGLDRLRGDPDRRVRASPRRPDRPSGLPHRGAVGLRARPHSRAPVQRYADLFQSQPRDKAPPMESAPARSQGPAGCRCSASSRPPWPRLELVAPRCATGHRNHVRNRGDWI